MRTLRAGIVAAGAVALVLAAGGTARADEVDDLISLVESQPDGMRESDWKEERRNAAKKLGKLGDTRAVPALIRVIETETFDVVTEHAIRSLGQLGDRSAIPVLKKVVASDEYDPYAKELAETALRKLGADASAIGAGDDDDDGGFGTVGTGNGGTAIGSSADATIDEGPEFADDVLGATEILRIAAGNASVSYDTVREIASIDGAARGTYRREVEKVKLGYGYGGDLGVAGGVIDLPGAGSASRAVEIAGAGGADAHFYIADQLYAHVEAALGLSFITTKVEPSGPDNTIRETLLAADLHGGFGVGYGRMLDMGEALRLRRIEIALEESRALGRPITPDLAARVLRAWWALRGEQGAHDRLVATVKILREAGVLLGEPDASTTYRILEILRDGQLDHRPEGIDVRLGVAESYLIRDEDLQGGVADGRAESVTLRARYGMQMARTTQEIVGEGFGRLRVLAQDGDPEPWSVGAAAAWRRYAYSDHYDPIGALELRAVVGLSDDDTDDGLGSRIGGGIGWIWSPNRASRYRISGNLTLETGELFLGAEFEATYGFLDVGYIGRQAYGAVK